jgi:hypothetical protein
MSKAIYVFSTLSSDHCYTVYHQLKKDDRGDKPAMKKGSVLIKGGANVVDRKHLITPKGVMTTVNEAEFKLLQEDPVFKRHVERGHITFSEKRASNQEEIDKVALADMNEKDKSAPIVEAQDGMKVSVGKIEEEA